MRALGRVLLLLACLLAGGAAARAADDDLCLEAIARVDARGGLPRGLLQAIALTGSGHRSTGTAAFVPWPWTVNNGGDGRYFDSKAEAIGWAEQLLLQKRRNGDLGCRQVKLVHHPDAFGDIEEGLDPLTTDLLTAARTPGWSFSRAKASTWPPMVSGISIGNQ